jgi:hypothetical protein
MQQEFADRIKAMNSELGGKEDEFNKQRELLEA